MNFRIADTFTDSLARLTGDEQKLVKTTAFDLQINPANPGMQFHKLDKAKDKDFWSVRVGSDLRLIVHKSRGDLLLCYVGHHDKAYGWAERRKLQTHPTTGAAQLVEIRETVQQIVIPQYVEADRTVAAKLPLFADIPDDGLLAYGVPPEWLSDVRGADEDSLLTLADRLPGEAAEALLELATGGTPHVRLSPAVGDGGAHPQARATSEPVGAVSEAVSPFDHPDAKRRFRLMTNVEELERALEFPWDKWSIFLHPEQRQLVERSYAGPARVSGSAGTGKTIVALHRAVFLARSHPNTRVLLTTFSDILANALRNQLRRLICNEPRLGERIDVHSVDAIGERLYKAHVGQPRLATREVLQDLLRAAADHMGGHKFSQAFLLTEWDQVVDAWQLETWEAYRDIARLGRKTRLPELQRTILWSIFEEVRFGLLSRKLITRPGMFSTLAAVIAASNMPPFQCVVVDEAQDLDVAHLRFLASLGGSRQDALFFTGDLGQRIFQQPFSWLALGVDIRGRSRTLRVNYRTSHQIRAQADRLLASEVSDVDGNKQERSHTVSVFNGPPPDIQVLKSQQDEIHAVGEWIAARLKDGVAPHEVGVFVRSAAELVRAQAAVTKSEAAFRVLDENVETSSGLVCVSTMHLAKGLEFRAVVVMACDDEVIPSQQRIENVTDDADLEDIYNTERHLLYVACTRARDHLLVTSVAPASEFLDDLRRCDPMSRLL